MADGQRTRHGAETWRQWIAEQRGGGQSEAAFCVARGLKKSTLQAWKRRLDGRNQWPIRARASARAGGALFTPLTQAVAEAGPAGLRATGWQVELELSEGLCLRLRRGA